METSDGESFEHQLEALEDLWSKLEKGSKVKLAGKEEEYYPLLMSIESAISAYYQEHPKLEDRGVIRALQAFIRNPGLSYQGGLRKRIQQHLQFTLSTHRFTQSEVKACLKYVLRSAKRHHARGAKGLFGVYRQLYLDLGNPPISSVVGGNRIGFLPGACVIFIVTLKMFTCFLSFFLLMGEIQPYFYVF